MVDPTFNREKAEAVLRQWWSAYGINQAPVNANTQKPEFLDSLIQHSDPERMFFDDKNSVIGKIERMLSRGVSTTNVLQALGNISAEIEWKQYRDGGSGTPDGISKQLDNKLTTANIDKQLSVIAPDALGGTGFTDKELTKKYDQFIARILPRTTAGLSLSGFDSNVQTNLKNTINQMNGMDRVKEKIAQAFAAGVNDRGEPIDFENEDTILKSISNVNHNWGDSSTTSNLAARDLAIASLFLSKTPSSPSQYTSWVNTTFKDAASSAAYAGDPMGYAGTASSSSATSSDWRSKFSQNILDNESSGRWVFDGFVKDSSNQIGQFTDQQGNKINVKVKGQVTDIGPQNEEVTTEIPSQIIPPDKDWREVLGTDRLALDAATQEWNQSFKEDAQAAQEAYQTRVQDHIEWYNTTKVIGATKDRELKERLAKEQNQLAEDLQEARLKSDADLQALRLESNIAISDAQIASRETIAEMAYEKVTADTTARLAQAGLELDFAEAKWADQLVLATAASELEADKFEETKQQFDETIALQTEKFEENKRQFGETLALEMQKFEENKNQFGQSIAEKMRQFDTLSAADQATFDQRYQFWNNLSAAEKATLDQQNFQFENLSAAEEQSFKQDMFKFQNVSASDQASLDLQQRMFEGVSGNTQATLDQDMFKFANISALDTAQLAQDESQFSRNLSESGRQFNIGEAGDTLRTQIGTQPALMGAITDRDRLMNEMLSQGGNYLARAFNQYGQAAPTDQPSVADRVNALRAQTVEQNALAQMGADAANDAIKQAEYQKYMQTAAQSAQARWDEYVAANTSTTGGGTYQFANPNFNADEIAAQRANLTAAAQEAQARADYFSGTDYTDPITKQVYEADIFPQGVPDIGFQAAAAQPHLDAATAAQAALDNYQAPSQFLTGENPAESVYTGMNRNQWNQQYGQANNMQDWWNTVADQPAMQQRFTQPDLAPVQPMTSMEELVALSRGFLSPASQDVYFGDAARPRTGFGFALPSYQQLQRLTPEERDALNTAMLTEFNVPLANAVFEERLRGQPTRTTAPAASARPTQMFRRAPYRTTNTGLRESTAPIGQVREVSRQPMFRSS
jgi:hypothetical protein